MMIDLRSDTVTLPSNNMRQFIINAPLGDDVYGEDPSINNLEEKVAELFGKEKALFVPSGTMANLISVLAHCNRGDEVLVGDKSHIFYYEAGGISAFGGIHSHQIKNEIDGTIKLERIENSIRKKEDVHFPKTKLLCLENTHNLCNGFPITQKYISSVRKLIDKYEISLHIDGARIFNASVALNVPIKQLCENADSISCCLSKGLSAPAGSLIISNDSFIYKARKLRKALGGGMRQAGILAAAGIFSLENMISRLKEDHINAKFFADELANMPKIKVDNKNVITNIVFFNLNKCEINDNDFMLELLKQNIKIDYKGQGRFRVVTHCDILQNHITTVINVMKKILRN